MPELSMTESSGSCPRRKTNLIDRVVDGERVLLDAEQNSIHKLNPTASAIWDRCDGKRDVEAICLEVAREFDCSPSDIQDDVKALMGQLTELGILLDAVD